MKRQITILLTLFLLLSSSCIHTRPNGGTPQFILDDIMVCSAGIGSSFGVQIDLSTDLKQAVREGKVNLNSKTQVDDWVKGYFMQMIPEKDRLEAFRVYNQCMERREKLRTSGLDPKFVLLKEESETLSKRYLYTLSTENDISKLNTDSYSGAGYALKEYAQSAPDCKNRIMSLERQSLMFFIAAEIEFSKGNKSAEKYVEENFKACNSAISIYKGCLESDTNPNYRDWLTRQDVKWVIYDRLSECLAQQEYIKPGSGMTQLEKVILSFPEGYTRDNGFCKNAIYKRIGIDAQFLKCVSWRIIDHS